MDWRTESSWVSMFSYNPKPPPWYHQTRNLHTLTIGNKYKQKNACTCICAKTWKTCSMYIKKLQYSCCTISYGSTKNQMNESHLPRTSWHWIPCWDPTLHWFFGLKFHQIPAGVKFGLGIPPADFIFHWAVTGLAFSTVCICIYGCFQKWWENPRTMGCSY